MKIVWLILLVLLSGCMAQTPKESSLSSDNLNGNEKKSSVFVGMILNPEISDQQLKHQMPLQDLNATNEQGVSMLALIAATRPIDLVRLAIEHGADVNQRIQKTVSYAGETELAYDLSIEEFIYQVHNLKSPAKLNRTGTHFDLTATSEPKPVNLSASQGARLIEVLALIKAKKFELAQYNSGEIKKIQDNYQAWSQQAQVKLNQLSQPIAEIPEPSLPAVETHQKSPFETLAMFQQRMDEAKKQRDQQTAQLQADYRTKVEARNQQVAKNSAELKKLQAEIEQRNRVYQQQIQPLLAGVVAKVKAQQQRFIAEAMAAVYGAPYLASIEENGVLKYDAERGLMFAQLGFSGVALKHEVLMPVKAGKEAEQFYQQLKGGKLRPSAQFKFSHAGSNQVEFVKADVKYGQQTLGAKLNQNETFIAQAPVEVVLQTKDNAPSLVQNQVVFDEAALTQLTLQNPNIKDVQFEAFLMQEQQAFNDDIPQLLAQTPAAAIDRKKWLFVIGIEQYDQTDNILYSRRSAELFSQVASKTLGVHESRRVVLLDKHASSGRIQDELRLMLSKVAEGDQIYFYYSGHGLPVAEQGNAPYLLPADKIPDFIASDDFYQAQSIYRLLQNSQASSVMAFMDSCFTGQTDGRSVFGGTKAATRLQPKQTRFEPTGKVAILTAGNDKQFSNALPEAGHRLFSYYLMRAMLEGRYQKVGDLAERVRVEVNDKSLDLGGLNRQTPVFTGNPNLGL